MTGSKLEELKREKEALVRRWMACQEEAEAVQRRMTDLSVEIEKLNVLIKEAEYREGKD